MSTVNKSRLYKSVLLIYCDYSFLSVFVFGITYTADRLQKFSKCTTLWVYKTCSCTNGSLCKEILSFNE